MFRLKKRKLLHFQKGNGISPYIWAFLSILPFYFIFQSSSTIEIAVGISLTILFFITFRYSFISNGWRVYVLAIVLIGISFATTYLFNYFYFSFYIAYFIGNIKDRIAFMTLYIIHLVTAAAGINASFFLHEQLLLQQFPFVILSCISAILLPFSIYNRNERGQLQEKLEDANKRISELVKIEERQRIARDLHDTLGQKLSMIGLKSDLARKLIYKDPEKARNEMKDVQQTARSALNEVRKIVSQMRGIRLVEEIDHVKKMLTAAEISFECTSEPLENVPLLTENILSMCLKEAINNVVRHSQASTCIISIQQSLTDVEMVIKDNGIGSITNDNFTKGNGLSGMKERLEFVNGSLQIDSKDGTTLIINVPTSAKGSD
ncbi:sensor histidine kinase [Metabacillus malikii]|uniref:histidine kinase n=1 Tax=Metabacillus malikii TaxID=1504265 RepID=A0ABT9ZCA1_9BACI|nr:sensor histidine kinase [Metabacillus malikii]MDQ0229876.1 two-component system sensor histidine kinase DesK [Metabacillus malikii]